jgi:AcrR family transcriptional regulator
VQLGEEVVRNMILFGATRVFATRGMRATSVEHILEASGISRRTFYKMFRGKEDVAAALYRMGSETLLEGCRRAVAAETDPVRKIERCIDVHLANTRALGRLMFVLGGEAQLPESPLHARRMEVHESLAALLQEGHDALGNARIDPLLPRAIVFAMEAISRMVLAEGDEGRQVTEASLERARSVMGRLVTAALLGEGPRVAAVPLRK